MFIIITTRRVDETNEISARRGRRRRRRTHDALYNPLPATCRAGDRFFSSLLTAPGRVYTGHGPRGQQGVQERRDYGIII